MRLGEPFKNKVLTWFVGDVHVKEKSVYDNEITNVGLSNSVLMNFSDIGPKTSKYC